MHKLFCRSPVPRPFAMACLALSLLCFRDAQALDPTKAITQYVHDVWRTRDGLPQNSVNAIAQTRDGYIWLGTQEGLARFDGARFVVFDRSNTNLRRNYITSLAAGRDGSLWVGTGGGGLTRFQDGWTTYTTREGLLSDYVGAVFEDREGSVWIATFNGLNRLQNGRMSSYVVKDGLPRSRVTTMYEDREGTLWLGSRGGGLTRFRDGKFTTYTQRDGLPNDTVWSVHEDRRGTLWIGTEAGGLTRWTEGKVTTDSIGGGNPKAVVISILEDRDKSLWLGTYGDGLRRGSQGKWEAYRTGDNVSENSPGSLFEDKEGNIWIGTFTGGAHRLANSKFTTYGRVEGLSDNSVMSVFEDRAGRIWIGTLGGGLNKLEGGRVAPYEREKGDLANNVASLWEDREGILWVGTWAGLRCLKNGRFIDCGGKEGLRANRVTGDRLNDLWFGSESRIYRLRDGRATSYDSPDGARSKPIFYILEDHEGVLWVGTAGGGLNRVEDGRLRPEPRTAQLQSDIVDVLYEDGQGSLWIGTNGRGLGRLKGGHLTLYAKKDGLVDDSVFQLLEDDRGFLWMGSNRGISRVRKQDFDEFDNGKIRSIPSIAYGLADGMRTPECNGIGQPAGWKGKDGRLWFATQGGAVVVDPDRLSLNSIPPPVLIEEVLVDDRLVDRHQEPRLPPGARRLDIHYTALSFTAPANVRFRYRLEGFDSAWVDAGTRRVAYYTNLPPGGHRFRVIACNNDGVWNEEGAKLDFTVLPAFYQTTWFFLLCLALIGCLAWAVYQWRVYQVTGRLDLQFRERLFERTRIARELHDTLLQSFQGLMLQFQDARDLLPSRPTEATQAFDNALDQADQAIIEGRDAIQGIRSLSSADAGLGPAITALGDELAPSEGAGSSATFRVSVEGTPRALRPIVRDEIYRIVREALRNAFHHARASRIEADITYGDKLRLRIRDNGTGIDPAVLDHGGRAGHWGLPGMRERARLVGVKLAVSSRQGTGTEIEISARGSIAYEGSARRAWFPFRRSKTGDEQRYS